MKVKLIKKLLLNNQLNIYLKDNSYSFVIESNRESFNIEKYDSINTTRGLLQYTYLCNIITFNFSKFPLLIKFFKNYKDLIEYLKKIEKEKLVTLLLIKKNKFVFVNQSMIRLQKKNLLIIVNKIKTQIFRIRRFFIFSHYIIKKNYI